MSEDRCVCCGEIVPEGRMVCPICERNLADAPLKLVPNQATKTLKPMKCNHPEEAPGCAFHYNGICTRDHNYECPALVMKNSSHGEMVQIAEEKREKPPRYIDADALYQKIADWQATLMDTYGKNDEYCICLESVLYIIDNFQPADLIPEFMKHYRQGLHDAELKKNGGLMQTFDPD